MNIRILAVLAVLAVFGGTARCEEVKIKTAEVNGRYVDDFSNLSFVNDPAVLGEWRSVDFVREPGDFVPGVKKFRDSLYLGGFKFMPGGKMGIMPFAPEGASWFGWTKGVVMHLGGDHTASRYTLKEIDGAVYMFFEWKSGDYIIRHQKPRYYVLKKAEPASPGSGTPSLRRTGRK